jgi:hypothetical protein
MLVAVGKLYAMDVFMQPERQTVATFFIVRFVELLEKRRMGRQSTDGGNE